MEKIKAYKCSHCSKILESYSGMWKHEKKCFYNPDTKSCIVCNSFIFGSGIGVRLLTDHEEKILSFNIPGTYTMKNSGDPEDPLDFPVLNDEFNYLYEAEHASYCNSKKCILEKLCTGC